MWHDVDLEKPPCTRTSAEQTSTDLESYRSAISSLWRNRTSQMAVQRNQQNRYRRVMTVIAQRTIELANRTQQLMRDRPVMLDVAFAILIFVVEIIDLIGMTDIPVVSREPDLACGY